MCYEEITCPSCSSLNLKKNGKTTNQKQRYRCKDCGRQFITKHTYRGGERRWQELIVPMALNGSAIRDTAWVLRLSPNTVLRGVRTAAAQVPEPVSPRRITDLEIDEFWSFVQSKQQQHWCWYGWDRQRKKVTAFFLGRRTNANCRRLMETHQHCQVRRFRKDDGQSYRKCLPAAQHQIHKRKAARNESNGVTSPFVPVSNDCSGVPSVFQNAQRCITR